MICQRFIFVIKINSFINVEFNCSQFNIKKNKRIYHRRPLKYRDWYSDGLRDEISHRLMNLCFYVHVVDLAEGGGGGGYVIRHYPKRIETMWVRILPREEQIYEN